MHYWASTNPIFLVAVFSRVEAITAAIILACIDPRILGSSSISSNGFEVLCFVCLLYALIMGSMLDPLSLPAYSVY